tara:strand:- start:599 stop:784 length:186 start_codon:yes stop_codon:yes gene_type:complete
MNNTRMAGERLQGWNPFHWKEILQEKVDSAMDAARNNPNQRLIGGSGMHGNREILNQYSNY